MNKRNTYIPIMIFLFCITAAPSFYLYSSYSSRRIPAGKRPQGYTGPRNLRQRPTVPVAQPAQAPAYTPATVATRADDDQVTTQTAPKPQAEPTAASQSMQAKAAPSAPGMLMTAYIVLLSTLNKAFGTGIELGYKPLSQSFMQRQEFLNAKNTAQEQATKAVLSGEFTKNIQKNIASLKALVLSPDDPQYSERDEIIGTLNQQLNSTTQEQISSLTKELLRKQIKNADQLEKQTSFGSIASQTLYLSLFNTATRVIGGIIGLGATMLLQSLVPTQN